MTDLDEIGERYAQIQDKLARDERLSLLEEAEELCLLIQLNEHDDSLTDAQKIITASTHALAITDKLEELTSEHDEQRAEIDRQEKAKQTLHKEYRLLTAEIDRLKLSRNIWKSGGEWGEGEIKRLTTRNAALEQAVEQEKRNSEMSDGCLHMIREDLEALGTDMSATPPMMYNDAIRATALRIAGKEAMQAALEAAAQDVQEEE